MKKIYALMFALFLVNGAMAQWFTPDDGTLQGLSSIYFTDINNGYVLDINGDVQKTTDGGFNWVTSLDLIFPSTLFFVNTDTGFVAAEYLMKTFDGGNNWIIQYSGTGWMLGRSLFFTDANTGYCVGENNYIYPGIPPTNTYIGKTTDGGLTWVTQLFQYDAVKLTSVFFINSDEGYTVGDSGTIMKTYDGGSNWIEQSSGTNVRFNSVFFPSADTGYIVGGSGTILKTTDGGSNWMAQTSGTKSELKSVFFTDVNTGYAVGGDDTYEILNTTNGGLSWCFQYIEGVTDEGYLSSVFFPVADTGYIGSFNHIYKTENGGGFPVGINDQNHIANTLKIYPTPAFTSISIETTSKGTLSIHNTSGQQLLQQEITEPTTTMDVSGWKSGIYVVKVVGEKGVSVGKFVL